jgi:hypothetical protein
MRGTALDRLIEDFGRLTLDDREFAADLIKKQLIEAKREAISNRAKSAGNYGGRWCAEFREGEGMKKRLITSSNFFASE